MRLLLDTCAVIWMGSDQPIAPLAEKAVNDSLDGGDPPAVSPISAWELGLLVSRNRLRLPLTVVDWFRIFVEKSKVHLLDLTPVQLAASSFLPANPPRDPADRIIIATARNKGLTILTRDRQILDYANQGHVMALEC